MNRPKPASESEPSSFVVRRLDPAADAELLHRWLSEPRARFWGLLGHSRQELQEIYEYVDSLETHHAFILSMDGTPQSLFQTYQPEHDPLGELYPVREGDLGIHLFLGPDRPPNNNFTTRFLAAALHWLFADAKVLRLVAEPDQRNEKAHRLLSRIGFHGDKIVELPEKKALLMFLERSSWVQVGAHVD